MVGGRYRDGRLKTFSMEGAEREKIEETATTAIATATETRGQRQKANPLERRKENRAGVSTAGVVAERITVQTKLPSGAERRRRSQRQRRRLILQKGQGRPEGL